MQAKGTLGLIATNTVAQGDTREVGLDAMVGAGFTITRAIQSRSWPASSANLEYAAVWGTTAPVPDSIPRIADDEPVSGISTLLEAAGRVQGVPRRLKRNVGIAHIGSLVLGKGFIIDPELAKTWLGQDARNCEVVYPYLNGEDLNSRPDGSASRWVIDFADRSLEQARRYPEPLGHLVRFAKAEREAGPRKAYRDRWWQFAEKQMSMRRAIADLSEVLVIALVSKTVMPLRVPAIQVFSHMLGVFATDDYGDQAVLSSSLHQLWAITYGSTLETRVRYTPSDVFETFPRPVALTPRLEELGRRLDQDRRGVMTRRDLGLTKLYNLINDPSVRDDPDVSLLRSRHVEIDEAVIAAYGWSDVDLGHGFHAYRQALRWTISAAARAEVLDRLLAENLNRSEAGGGGLRTLQSARSLHSERTLFD